ncbi:hypothetical protein QP157_00440 [Sphingomonas sp. LR61]
MHAGHERERDEPDEQDDRDAAHRHQGRLRVLDLRASEGLHAVRDGLDAGQGRAAGGEGAEQQQDERRLRRVLDVVDGVPGGLGDRGVPGGHLDQAGDDHHEDRRHEQVGGDGERLARLPHAAQVRGGEEHDEHEREFDADVVQHG